MESVLLPISETFPKMDLSGNTIQLVNESAGRIIELLMGNGIIESGMDLTDVSISIIRKRNRENISEYIHKDVNSFPTYYCRMKKGKRTRL